MSPRLEIAPLEVVIAGGKLQGVEASFLARSLGWEVVLIDSNPNAPARGLCDSFYQCDFVRDDSTLRKIIKKVDLVVPALENVLALKSLERCAASAGVPFAYDEKAHFITRSKKRSNRFFHNIGIPTPEPWPRCVLPVIVKPSCQSGSKGVARLSTEEEFSAFLKDLNGKAGRWVIEEYLEGQSYSLEVFGLKDRYEILQVTELEMDDQYDCKRVRAPANLSDSLERRFKELTLKIAKALRLKGIMDVEVIQHQGYLKVLEIDARLPSQTPTTVLKSTGVNMLGLLRDIFVRESLPAIPNTERTRGVIYEHIRVSESGLEVLGEHLMADAGPLKTVNNFFGADVALTNFNGSRFPWVATLIITAENPEAAWVKHRRVIQNIENDLKRTIADRPSYFS
jgi:pyrrolysine biosynthesis protein PylC